MGRAAKRERLLEQERSVPGAAGRRVPERNVRKRKRMAVRAARKRNR
jgi:hypothetical protein